MTENEMLGYGILAMAYIGVTWMVWCEGYGPPFGEAIWWPILAIKAAARGLWEAIKS